MSNMQNENDFQARVLQTLDSLAVRIQSLEMRKLVGGSGIKIQEKLNGLEISAERDDFDLALKNQLLEQLPKIENMKKILCSDGSIGIQECGHSLYLYSTAEPIPDVVDSGSRDAWGDFPFRVKILSNYENNPESIRVLVCGYNPEKGRFFQNFVYGGLDDPIATIPETEISLSRTSGYTLYLMCELIGNNSDPNREDGIRCRLTDSRVLSDDVPVYASYLHPIAKIHEYRQKFILTQYQFGHVRITGRAL